MPKKIGKSGSGSPRGNGSGAGAGSTDREFDAIAKDIQGCLRSEGASIVTQQFAAGRLVLAVQQDGKYGDEGVRKLAIKLKRSPKWLYRLSARAKAFSAENVVAAIATAAANNYILGVSIFDELVNSRDDERQLFLEAAIRGHWTVKELGLAAWGPRAKPKRQVARLKLPRVIGCAEALMAALEAVPMSIDAQQLDDRERTLTTLSKLSIAVNEATQRLIAAAAATPSPSPSEGT